MIVTFLVGSVPQPYGGNIVCYELANALRRAGHRVNIAHLGAVDDLRDLSWFRFDGEVEHLFLGGRAFDLEQLPSADFVVNPPSKGSSGIPPRVGLPLNLIQGYGALRPEVHHARMTAPWPKICIARWLLDIARDLGVPDEELVLVPPGIDHEKYRVITPIEARRSQVAALYHANPVKGTEYAIDAVAEVQRRVPELRSVFFGVTELKHTLPPGSVFLHDPAQRVLVEDAYNQTRVFVCGSTQEGFGLCSVEAMACGSALVTSACRGSDDFAFHGETALVSEPRDVAALAGDIESLLRDDARRIALAQRGASSVARFDWNESARLLVRFLEHYRDRAESGECSSEA